MGIPLIKFDWLTKEKPVSFSPVFFCSENPVPDGEKRKKIEPAQEGDSPPRLAEK